MKIIPIILCGGAGSRLWPVSRETHPKPFINLPDGQSLLQKAYLRALEQENIKDIITVTNRDLYFKTKDAYQQLGHNEINNHFILEPFGRNTAAAVALAALLINYKYNNAIMLVLAADHLIKNKDGFSAAVANARKLAEKGKIVAFGVKPEWAETGYGYIEARGEKVINFVEKPDKDLAEKYFSSGKYFWNSGIFCFKASSIIEEMKIYCPDILKKSEDCLVDSLKATKESLKQALELKAQDFSTVREDSIDYAVMEKTKHAAVVTCDIGWSDIGSWTALGSLSPIDDHGNHVRGETVLHKTKNTTIHAENRLVATVGLNNMLVIETPDAVLVASKDNAQDVKNIYSLLKNNGHSTYKEHLTVKRPWGSYTVLEEGPNFKIKRIEVKPDSSLSLQMHQHRSEHWIVIEGCATIFNDGLEKKLFANESTFIPAGHKHRLTNDTEKNVIIIEVQTGHYLGEDDIIRINDIYGRT